MPSLLFDAAIIGLREGLAMEGGGVWLSSNAGEALLAGVDQLHMERSAGEFWRGVLQDDVTGDRAQIEKELYDYHFLMNQVSQIYSHVTGGAMSKLSYTAEAVISVADEHINKRANQGMRDAFEVIRDTVLEQQFQLEGSGMTNEQINAVLDLIDEHTPAEEPG